MGISAHYKVLHRKVYLNSLIFWTMCCVTVSIEQVTQSVVYDMKQHHCDLPYMDVVECTLHIQQEIIFIIAFP